MVGQQITKLNPVRAFCVALSAAITVLIASGLGLPVSSTHIAVGAVFGVGFLREYMSNQRPARAQAPASEPATEMEARHADIAERLESHMRAATLEKRVRKAARRKLVRRQHAMTIAAAWIITVPLAALLAAGLFYVLTSIQEF